MAVGWLCTKAWASCGSLPGSAALRPLSAIVVVLMVVLVGGIAAFVVGIAVLDEVVRGLLSNCKSKLDVAVAALLAVPA